MNQQQERQAFVSAKVRQGVTKSVVKSQFREKFGPESGVAIERMIRSALTELSTETLTDTEMTHRLEGFRLWTAVQNIVFCHIRGVERSHQRLGLPKPSDMLRLQREWGVNVPPPETSISEIESLLVKLKQHVATKPFKGTNDEQEMADRPKV